MKNILILVFLIFSAGAANAQNAQELFDKKCAPCHGFDGRANTPVGKAVGAKNLQSDEVRKLTDEQIYTQIEKGKRNMPPFGGQLTKPQIDDLVKYVRGLSKGK